MKRKDIEKIGKLKLNETCVIKGKTYKAIKDSNEFHPCMGCLFYSGLENCHHVMDCYHLPVIYVEVAT